MQINKTSIVNLSVRGLTIVSRFVLLFYLGKFFSSDDLGAYGIFYTTTSMTLLTLGLDFYTFSNREVLYVEDKFKLSVLRNQLVFYVFTYSLFLFPLLLVFTYQIISFKYIVYFYLILVFEHLSQEFYRLFTILSFPILANWLLFLRNGLWVIVLIACFSIFRIEDYSLSYVFMGWLIGSGLSVIIGFYTVFKLYGSHPLQPIDWKWYIQGIKTSSLYFLSTISLILIEHMNRYLIKYWCGLSKVGVFTFYSQISNAMNVVIFTLFIMVIYPKLVEAANLKDMKHFMLLKAELQKKVVLYSIVIGLVLALGIFPMLSFINKPEYYQDIFTFYLLIAATVFLNLSLVQHYALYALKKDRLLLYSSLLAALTSVVSNLLLIKGLSILGAAFSLLLSCLVLVLAKSYFSKKAESDFIQKNNLSDTE